MRGAFREQRAWLSRINAYLNENITGMSVIQLFNRQQRNFNRFDERNTSLLHANQRVVFFYAIFDPIVVMFNALTTALIVWYGGSRVIDSTITLGTLVAFLAYMQRFFYPIRDLSERLTTLQQSMASCERIFGILDEPEEVTDAPDARSLGAIEGKIEFRDVWFAYDEGNWVLRDMSFTIQPGEKVAIVGATGAGKSTMMSLLNRFYDVQRGAILIDGVPVTELRQQELRRQVGLVLQDPFIFTDTVEENIRMRDFSLSLETVHEAGRTVGADAFIQRLPDGYATVLAERGANLSTGQKQLVALARVAAFNPQIVLVMDEATASVDPETEATLQRQHPARDGRQDVDRHRPPPKHDPLRGPHPRPAPRHHRRRGHARSAARSPRRLLPPVRAAVQGPGHRRRLTARVLHRGVPLPCITRRIVNGISLLSASERGLSDGATRGSARALTSLRPQSLSEAERDARQRGRSLPS